MPERYLGRTLGKYIVESLLGTGGFAWVYKAHDPELDIPVALKLLKPQFAGDADFEERFRREASTAARLRHPNIVTIYSVGREGDAVFFAMDYLPQGLSDRLAVMPILPPAVTVQVARDVANALAFAHRQGVVHRDIKPDNILFDGHGNAVVADFGIARAVASHAAETGTQLVVGTPQYFAPEQARGRPLDGRADLYALGVTLYRCAAGVLPFPGDDWFEVAKRQVEEEPADVRSHNPALPLELARVIHRLLEKDPGDRFQTAEELQEALAAIPLVGDATTATGRTMAVPALDRLWTSTGMTARRRRLRRRALWTLGAASVATAAIVAIGAALQDDVPAGAALAVPADSLAMSALVPPLLDSVTVIAPDSAARREALPTTGTLALAAPADARLFLDGREVGVGSWRGRAIAAGPHVVAAEVASPAGCDTRRLERRVVIAAGQTSQLRLDPRACGLLELNVVVNGKPLTTEMRAEYRLSGDGSDRRGPLPLAEPLVLPGGTYRLSVDVPQLCTFGPGEIIVEPGKTNRERIAPFCR